MPSVVSAFPDFWHGSLALHLSTCLSCLEVGLFFIAGLCFSLHINVHLILFLLAIHVFRKTRIGLSIKICKIVFVRRNKIRAILSSVGSDVLFGEMKRFENQYRGRELPGFVNYRTFETIIKEQVRALEEPAVDLLHRVTGECLVLLSDILFLGQRKFEPKPEPNCKASSITLSLPKSNSLNLQTST
jgi:hypothetical protein